MLYAQGVPDSNVIALLPVADGMTVKNPKTYPGGPTIAPPPFPRSPIDNRRIRVGDVQCAMTHLLLHRELDSVVFIFLNHRQKDLLLVDRDVLDVEWFQRLFETYEGGWTVSKKNILVILDSCYSTVFAQQVMDGAIMPKNIWIITASAGVSMTTLVVIGNHHSLVNQAQDGSGLDYGIYGSMLARGLIDIIAYSNRNPTLTALPGELLARFKEGASPGFEPSCVTLADETLCPSLRYFFPDAVTGGRAIALQQYLPKIPDGGAFDDHDRATAASGAVLPGQRYYRFVRIEAIPGGFDVKGYGVVEVRKDSPDAIAQQLARDENDDILGPGGKAKTHVCIIDLMWEALKGLTPHPEIDEAEEKRRLSEIHDVLRDINGLEGNDPYFFPFFVDCWGAKPIEEWKTVIQEAHDRLVEDSRNTAPSS
jgi:hypothetical protein